MKIKVFILISFVLLLSSSVSAQSKKELNDFKIKLKYDFVSTSYTGLSSKSSLKLSNKALFDNNSNLLLITGHLLQGFKFSSPIDQFNATNPFDIRGYQPRNFSSYVSYFNDTALLQQKIRTIK
jgi:hypothetical protein